MRAAAFCPIFLLSLAEHGREYSGVNRQERALKEFPDSPLSSGNEPAVYRLQEYPDTDSTLGGLDINEEAGWT